MRTVVTIRASCLKEAMLTPKCADGSQVDPGYPSYVIVPETYDDVFTDVPADGETGDGEY